MTPLSHSVVTKILKRVEYDYQKHHHGKGIGETDIRSTSTLFSEKGIRLKKVVGSSRRGNPYLTYQLRVVEDDEHHQMWLERIDQMPPLLKKVTKEALPEPKSTNVHFRPAWSRLPPLEFGDSHFCRSQTFPGIPRWAKKTRRDWVGPQIVLPESRFDYARIEVEFVLALTTCRLVRVSDRICSKALIKFTEQIVSRVSRNQRLNSSIGAKEDLVSMVLAQLLAHYDFSEGPRSLENLIIAYVKDFSRRRDFQPSVACNLDSRDQNDQEDVTDKVGAGWLVETGSRSGFNEEYEDVLQKKVKGSCEPFAADTLSAKEELTGFEALSLYKGVLTRQTLYANKNKVGRYDEEKGKYLFWHDRVIDFLTTARLSAERKRRLNEILPLNIENVIRLATKRRKGRNGKPLGRKAAVQLVRRKQGVGWSLREIACWLERNIPQ